MIPLVAYHLDAGDDGDPEKPRGVFLGALDGDQFMLMVSVEEFYATAALLYDPGEARMLAGFVTGFGGRLSEAVAWLDEFENDHLPDLLFPDEDEGEEDEDDDIASR